MVLMIDTNIVLDVLCKRNGFYEDSLTIFKLCETKKVEGHISALSIANIVYILRKELDFNDVKQTLSLLNSIFVIDDLKQTDLLEAANREYVDFEDSLQVVNGERIKANYLITRNVKHFINTKIPVLTPSSFLKSLN